MKKIITLTTKRCLPLLVFICAQAKVWAADTTTTNTIAKTESIFSQPWIWIAAIVLLIIKLIGPLKEDSKEFVVIRKKGGKQKKQ